MSQKLKTYFNWSSGKDAALALYQLQKDENYEVDILVTSINAHHDRVSMHGLRRALLVQQAKSVGLPLVTLELSEEPTMEEYNERMQNLTNTLKSKGYAHCGFGDIFLEDLRAYREDQLKSVGITGHFPLWKRDTKKLIMEFLALGFRAIVICIKSELLDASFVGREINEDFIKDLPANVDPCGENGEFHTFCFDGPIFKEPIQFTIGDKVFREYKMPKEQGSVTTNKSLGFWFIDLLPTAN